MNDERIKDLFRIWNRERNKKASDIIDVIISSCESQSQCLQDTQDVRWDVYDHDNWDNMVKWLDEIKLILINGETHENKTETTREYGKEL